PHDIKVLDEGFFHAAARGLYGLREAYVDRAWDVDRLDELTYRFLRSTGCSTGPRHDWVRGLTARFERCARWARSRRSFSAAAHYNLGNDLFEVMLGPSMVYSC